MGLSTSKGTSFQWTVDEVVLMLNRGHTLGAEIEKDFTFKVRDVESWSGL